MSDLRDVARATRTDIGYECETCGDTYPSMRAAWLCEERDIAEAREARRPARHVMRPASYWEDD